MIRRPLKRSWIARMRALLRRARPLGEGTHLERPVRLRPERIRIWEEYRYSFTAGANPVYRSNPDKVSGEIQIDLPFDSLSPSARADSAAVLGVEPGAVIARYGALGFGRLERTDIPERFFEDESHSHYALPLSVPLVRENEPTIVVRSERGDHERQHLYYTPADPVPFPFTLELAISKEGATLTSGAKPTTVSGQQRVIHAALEISMMRPAGVSETDVKLTLDVFLLFWCAPVAQHHFQLDGPSDATLNVDARMNALSVGGAEIPFTSAGRGLLRGRIDFRILVKEPVDLKQSDEVKGLFKVTGHGITMSAMRAQFFDAAGYVEHRGADGAPLIDYKSELYGNFTLPLDNASHDAPILLERHLTWFSPESAPDAFPVIRDLLLEENFAPAGELHPEPNAFRWSVARDVDGKLLTVDLILRQRDSLQLVELSDTDLNGGRKPAALQQMIYHDLTLSARYRGEWAHAQNVIGRVERRLRDRLHLRRRNTEGL